MHHAECEESLNPESANHKSSDVLKERFTHWKQGVKVSGCKPPTYSKEYQREDRTLTPFRFEDCCNHVNESSDVNAC